jgi:magnesium transporter
LRKIKYKQVRKIQPHSLEYTGKINNALVDFQLFVYNKLDYKEYNKFEIGETQSKIQLDKINWFNIHGLSDSAMIQAVGSIFTLDKFILSEVLNTDKRSKIEEFSDLLFFNIKSMLPEKNSDLLKVEQISFILKNNVLVSFQEQKGDFFNHIRERIRTDVGLVREKGADYLLYILLDAIMENFYITIEAQENGVEEMQMLAKQNANREILIRIEKFRDNYNFLKRSIIPLRDSLYAIKTIKEDATFNEIDTNNYTFFDRLHQKSLELLEQIEYDLTTVDSVSNFYFSTQNHKMNEVMKTLTVVSVFFMPLTFIVGIYGMNFDNMPELHWQYGYFSVLGFMIVLLIGMIIYFKRKNWF